MKRSISTLLTTLLFSAAILPIAAQAQTTEATQTSFNASFEWARSDWLSNYWAEHDQTVC
jgi:hypothetical protein